MQISDAVIRGGRNLTKNRKQTKKDKKQKTDQKTDQAKGKKTALFRANKHLEKFIISNCRSV